MCASSTTAAETEAQSVDSFWFQSTGDARVKWGWPSVVDPSPELDAELFTGAEATGWVTVLARQGETNLMIIFEPFLSSEEGDEAFLALQENARVAPLDTRLAEEERSRLRSDESCATRRTCRR